ncbi:Alanine--tRNA ligase [archaeon HR01]|nr:Alanine--tRNA ligase [archaeon HR01]
MDNILSDLAEILSSPVADVPKKVAELDEELRNTRRKLKSLKEKLMPAKVAAIRQVGVKAGRVTLYIDDEEDEEDAEYMVKLAAETVNVREPAICLLMRGSPNSRIVLYVNDAAANLGYDAGQLASQFCQMAGGRGGGRRSLGQGSAPRSKAFESINEFITLVASPRS